MLYPEFMEYRRPRQGAAAPIGGRGSGRGMDDPHRQRPRLDSGASWSRGRPPTPPQRAGSVPGGYPRRNSGGRGFEYYRFYQPSGRGRGGEGRGGAGRGGGGRGGGARGSGGYCSSSNTPPAQPNSSGPPLHAFAASYLPDGYATAPVDRGSISRWENPPHQRYEEQGGFELANYAGGGNGDGSSGGVEGGYDYGHLSGGFSGGGEFHQQEASRRGGDYYEGYAGRIYEMP